ncbi:glycosyltransferase family 2 protein [Streptomyces sp. NPDC058284]|uniref:glycosyltransferase family 2 protein n=1 Tax=unclassified Streptomyces TaxID=2593676 RepID=UPI00365AEE35
MKHARTPSNRIDVTFTVICPTYNRSRCLLRTLESVRAQTVTDWELLVLSDGSDDDTVEVAETLAAEDRRIRVLQLKRFGHPSGPRQEGLGRARGRYVAYINHDDLWRQDHLAVVLPLLDAGAPVVATGYRAVDDTGSVIRRSAWWDMCWHPELQVLDPLFEPSRLAHRRGVPEAVGGWRITEGLEDWDLLLRLTDAGHRIRTTTARTVTLHEGHSTRRHSVTPSHLAPLHVTPDAHAARRLRDALRTPAVRAELLRAAQEDSRTRIQRLRHSSEFVSPAASEDAPGDRGPTMADEVLADRGPEPLVIPHGGAYALVVPVSTPGHAARFAELLQLHAPAQLAVVRALAEEVSL